jgi:hypothetical protein
VIVRRWAGSSTSLRGAKAKVWAKLHRLVLDESLAEPALTKPSAEVLAVPTLTGTSPQQLAAHAPTLAPDGDTQRGRPPRLALSDQVLATALYLRVALAAKPLPRCSTAVGQPCTARCC